jgi:hypothetical protein
MRHVTAVHALAALLLAGPAAAQNRQLFPAPTQPVRWGGFDVTSTFEAGYRTLDVDKNETLFRHDYQLDDGPRLFTFSFTGVSDSGPVDRFTIDLSNLGDPFQTARATVRKTGRYSASFGVRSIDRFYQYDAPRADGVTEFRLYDTTRRIWEGAFDVRVPRVARIGAEYRQTAWSGDNSFQTRDWSRDEFHVRSPFDVSSKDLRVWGERRLGDTTVVLEQSYRWFSNRTVYSVPTPEEGHSEGRSFVNSLTETNPQDVRIPTTVVRVASPISDRVEITASYLRSSATADFTGSVDVEGLDFQRRPTVERNTFAGDARKHEQLFDGDLTIDLRSDLALHNTLRYRRYDIDGAVDITEFLQVGSALPVSGFEEAIGNGIKYRRTSYSPELEYVPGRGVSVRGGARFFRRDVQMFDDGLLDDDSSVTGDRVNSGFVAFLSASWRPAPRYRLIAEYERGDADNALTRISPLGTRRVKLRAQADLGAGWKVNGSLVDQRYDTEDISESTWRSASAFVSYARSNRLVLDAGYTRQLIDLATATFFYAPAATEGFSRYNLDTDIVFSQAEVKVHRRVAVNGGYQVVRSNGTYPTTFDRAALGSTVTLNERYYVTATLWDGGYRERDAVALGNFDYDFRQLMVNFGYRF